jgi:hypothetical protein
VRAALKNAKRVVVLEKSLAVGIGGIVSTDVRMALSGIPIGYTVVAGLGGRPITKKSLHEHVRQGRARRLWSRSPSSTSTGRWSNKRTRARAQKRRSGRPPKTSATCATSGPSPRTRRLRSETMSDQPSSSTRPAPSPSATACSP